MFRSLAAASGRALVAPLFILGARNALKNSGALGGMIEAKASELGIDKLPASGKELVTVNAYSQIALGSALGLGIFPRLAALGLVGSLVPTTLVGHAFWEEDVDAARNNQMLQFVKNFGVIGGLLNIYARD